MAGALSFVGGFFNGLNNIQAADAEKRMRDQERFGQLAMNSIMEYKREIGTVKKQHDELNAMGKQLIASGVEPEKVDYALGLPYAQAVKFLSDPEALRNVQVKPRTQAPAQAAPQAPTAAPEAAPTGPGSMVAPPPAGAPVAPASGAGTVMPQQPAAPGMQPAPTAPQTFGIREGTQDPLAGQRQAIEELAKNAGWSPAMMRQFQQAMGTGQNLGVYKFANPETAGQLIFNDPKQVERVMKANEHAMGIMLTVAARLNPNLPPEQKVEILGEAFANAYKGVDGNAEGAVMPSPDMFRNLTDPTFARNELTRKEEERKLKTTVEAYTAEYVRQGMPADQARVRAEATARGMTERQPTQGPDPNPGFNQIYAMTGAQFKGEIIPDSTTGQLRVNITDPALRAEALFATTIAQEAYRTSLEQSGARGTAMTPSQAVQVGMNILSASKTMLTTAMNAGGKRPDAAIALLQRNLQQEIAKPDANPNKIKSLQGAITLAQIGAEASAPAAPPAPPARSAPPARPAPPTPPEAGVTVGIPPAQ